MRTISTHYTVQKLPKPLRKFSKWFLLPIGNKKDMMSVHNNEPSCPPSRKQKIDS